MISKPFTLDHKFLPCTAGEDKIDLQLSGWKIWGLNRGEGQVHSFKERMASPGAGQEDMAWPSPQGPPPFFGWFFLRPEIKGKNKNKLLIRRQTLIDTANKRRHEAPLCGGYGLLYKEKRPDPFTKKQEHRFKLNLSLNLQRFLRHQPLSDRCIPIPKCIRLEKRRGDRSVHDTEVSFDHMDNWLPHAQSWKAFAAKNHLGAYLQLIVSQVQNDIARACDYQANLDYDAPGGNHVIEFGCSEESYSLSRVETLWEFRSNHSMFEVFEIGKMLLHLARQSGSAKLHSFGAKEAQRIINSPCFTIPVAENVHLRLYPKTNKRIRFEIIQTNLMRERSALLKEAGLSAAPEGLSWDQIPHLVKAIRNRAAMHMNNVMDELRKGRISETESFSAANLLAEVAACAPPGINIKERVSYLQTLMVWVCFQRGYRGKISHGPYATALTRLKERGVLVFNRKRQFYTLSRGYIKAADSLITAAGEPLLQIFGADWGGYTFADDGKTVVHLRE